MTKEEQIWDEFMGKGDFASLSTHNKSLVKGILSAYAKQQAIAFVKWALESDKIHGDNWGDAFMPGDEEDVYNQFIEQQNKGNESNTSR